MPSFPSQTPIKNTIPPPMITCRIVDHSGDFINLNRISAINTSSTATTKYAVCKATDKSLIKNGSVCSIPPMVVATPVIMPLTNGFPRPVTSPSSDKASSSPILMPAPTDAASPTKNALWFGGSAQLRQIVARALILTRP